MHTHLAQEMKSALFMYAKLNPGLRYIQVTPLTMLPENPDEAQPCSMPGGLLHPGHTSRAHTQGTHPGHTSRAHIQGTHTGHTARSHSQVT